MMTFTSDQWAILALVFVLGLLVGAFMTAGGRRKWKTRYRDEVTRREALELDQREREADWTRREQEWREQDSLRAAAARDRSGPTSRDLDGDGVRDSADRRGSRDSDGDGVRDTADRRPTDDRRA